MSRAFPGPREKVRVWREGCGTDSCPDGTQGLQCPHGTQGHTRREPPEAEEEPPKDIRGTSGVNSDHTGVSPSGDRCSRQRLQADQAESLLRVGTSPRLESLWWQLRKCKSRKLTRTDLCPGRFPSPQMRINVPVRRARTPHPTRTVSHCLSPHQKCPVKNQENMNVTTIKTISHHAPEIAQKVSLADKSQTRWL